MRSSKLSAQTHHSRFPVIMSSQDHIYHHLPSLERDLEWLCVQHNCGLTSEEIFAFSTRLENQNTHIHQLGTIREDTRIGSLGRTGHRIETHHMVEHDRIPYDDLQTCRNAQANFMFDDPTTPVSPPNHRPENGSLENIVRHLTFSEFDEDLVGTAGHQVDEQATYGESQNRANGNEDAIEQGPDHREETSRHRPVQKDNMVVIGCGLACLMDRIPLAKRPRTRTTRYALDKQHAVYLEYFRNNKACRKVTQPKLDRFITINDDADLCKAKKCEVLELVHKRGVDDKQMEQGSMAIEPGMSMFSGCQATESCTSTNRHQ